MAMQARDNLRHSAICLLAIAFVVSMPGEAEACVCGPAPTCRLILFSDAVFVGRAVWVEEIVGIYDTAGPPEGFRARIRVEEVLLGTNERVGSVVVVDGQTGTDCSYIFQKGTRYVIFATRQNGQLGTALCSGTRPVDLAAESLRFLRALATAPQTGSVYGEFWVWQKTEMLKGMRIRLSGEGIKRDTMTDEKGLYEIKDVPPGEYTLEVSATEKHRGKSVHVNIVAHACQRMNFYLQGKRIIAESEL